MDLNELKRDKWATLFKWGLGFGGAVIISPVVFLAVKGIVGLAIAAISGFTIIQLAPVYSMKLANYKMKMITGEARDNPIETMRNLYIDKSKELQESDQNIVDFETEIGNYNDQLQGFKADYPAESDRFQLISDKMSEALDQMKDKQTVARKDLEVFKQHIKKAEAIYAMSLAAQKVTKFSKSAEQQVFAQIKEQVAFDSVRSQLNRSFASLNLTIEQRKDAKVLMAAPKPA